MSDLNSVAYLSKTPFSNTVRPEVPGVRSSANDGGGAGTTRSNIAQQKIPGSLFKYRVI